MRWDPKIPIFFHRDPKIPRSQIPLSGPYSWQPLILWNDFFPRIWRLPGARSFLYEARKLKSKRGWLDRLAHWTNFTGGLKTHWTRRKLLVVCVFGVFDRHVQSPLIDHPGEFLEKRTGIMRAFVMHRQFRESSKTTCYLKVWTQGQESIHFRSEGVETNRYIYQGCNSCFCGPPSPLVSLACVRTWRRV